MSDIEEKSLGVASNREASILRTNYIGTISSVLKRVMQYDGGKQQSKQNLGSSGDFPTS